MMALNVSKVKILMFLMTSKSDFLTVLKTSNNRNSVGWVLYVRNMGVFFLQRWGYLLIYDSNAVCFSFWLAIRLVKNLSFSISRAENPFTPNFECILQNLPKIV